MNGRKTRFAFTEDSDVVVTLNVDPHTQPNGGVPEGDSFWGAVNRDLLDRIHGAQSKWDGHRFETPRERTTVEVFECAPDLICGTCGKLAEQHPAFFVVGDSEETLRTMCGGDVARLV